MLQYDWQIRKMNSESDIGPIASLNFVILH